MWTSRGNQPALVLRAGVPMQMVAEFGVSSDRPKP